jgi:hypothetical protein
MDTIGIIILVLVIAIAVIAVVYVLWRRTRKKKEDPDSCPSQPFSLFDVRIQDLEIRLERIKETIRCLQL